jgi:hypothetical protein
MLEMLARVLTPVNMVAEVVMASSAPGAPHVFLTITFKPMSINVRTVHAFKTKELAAEFAEMERSLGNTVDVCPACVYTNAEMSSLFALKGKQRKETTVKQETPKKRARKQ